MAEEGVDLVLLQEKAHAVHIGADRVVLVLHHGGHIELGLADADAERRKVMGGDLEHFRGVQQGLGGDAADVEASAAMGLALLDDGHLHAELGRADGADIAAGAGSNDDEIVGHGDRFQV